MSEKVKVSREVAYTIESYLTHMVEVLKMESIDAKVALIGDHCVTDWSLNEESQYRALNDIDTFTLMQLLVNDYEIEQTPEEKILAAYEDAGDDDIKFNSDRYSGFVEGIRVVLRAYGHVIKGINDGDVDG